MLALDLAKCRHDQLVDGDARDYRAEDWIAFNDEHLLPLIWYIGRLCRTDHRDLTMVRATPEVVIQQPPRHSASAG